MGAQPARDFIGWFSGTLAPLANLSQLQTLDLAGHWKYGSQLEGQFPNFVGRQPGSHVIGGTGELQPLQNLNQLTSLNLEGCYRLTG